MTPIIEASLIGSIVGIVVAALIFFAILSAEDGF